MLRPHLLYDQLGATSKERQMAYIELFRHVLDPGVIDEIRATANGNFALGNNRFKSKITEALGRRVAPGKPGRPPQGLNIKTNPTQPLSTDKKHSLPIFPGEQE